MIGIKVEPEIKKVLQKLADDESRNLSNFCFHAIKVYVKEHFKILAILTEIAEYFKISERYKVCTDSMILKLKKYLKLEEIHIVISWTTK